MSSPAKCIDLSDSNLNEIPSRIYNKKNLNWLVLSNNNLRNIPAKISLLTELTRLALNDNRIESIDKNIGKLKALTWIDLTRNRLRTLPDDISNLKNLNGLGLSENEFEEIPNCIYKLICLKKFGFFANRLTRLSPEIRQLVNLVKIDLSNNGLVELPDEISELKNLTWLNLSNNRLKKLPTKLNKLSNLEELGLGSNCLEEMPNLYGLRKLRILPIFKNKIKTLEGLKTLESLEKLDLSDNLFTEFPNDILFLRNLHYINVKNNQIQKLCFDSVSPEVVSYVTMVDINDNKLEYLPVKFFKIFPHLNTVRLTNNPYKIQEHIKPRGIPDLVHMCYSKMINSIDKNLIKASWLKNLFEQRHKVCDYCGELFTKEPFVGYNSSTLGESNNFIIRRILCSRKCYNEEYNRR